MQNEHPRLAEMCPASSPGAGHSKGDILAINNGGLYVTSHHLLAGSDKVLIQLLPEAFTQPTIVPRMQVLHTQAGPRKATNQQAWAYAARPDVVGDAHFYGPEMDSGNIIQALPFNVRGDSQYKANYFQLPSKDKTWYGAISMETQDNGSASLAVTEWSFPQLGTMCAILTAVCFTYETGCNLCGWALDTGIAPHAMYANDPVYPWSKTGHDCPRAARIRQVPFILNEVASRLAKIYQDCGETCPGT